MATKQTIVATVTTEQSRGNEDQITISTIGLDRDADEVVPEGGDFTAYKKNPTVLWGHDMSAIPIGTTTALEVVPGRGIRARFRWLDGDEFAARVRNAYEQGIVRAASIGFKPIESEPNGLPGGRRYTKWELLEWSLVAVPANPEAVRTLKRLDLWRDTGETVLTLRDDHSVVTRTDVDSVLRDVVRSLIREARSAAIRRELTTRRLGDPFALSDEKEAWRSALKTAVADIAATLPEMVSREFARRRGRVD